MNQQEILNLDKKSECSAVGEWNGSQIPIKTKLREGR